jgi:hypothetical protein
LAVSAAPILLDNFNEAKTENALGGATGAWYDPEDTSIYCKTEFDDKVFFGPVGPKPAVGLQHQKSAGKRFHPYKRLSLVPGHERQRRRSTVTIPFSLLKI